MSICNNQDSFNDSVYKALKYSRKKEYKKISGPLLIYSIIHLIFMIWGILLAFRQPENKRIIHIVFAIVFGPVYVLAFYLNET